MQELIAGLGCIGPIIIVVIIWLAACIRVVNEYERAVIFTLGKVGQVPKGPGLIFVLRPFQRAVVVSLRTVVLDVPSQDIITRDNVRACPKTACLAKIAVWGRLGNRQLSCSTIL
jgi:regulator of protease activity HflC (stomatin/prohibitin superfamily)